MRRSDGTTNWWLGSGALLGYVFTILLANWLIVHVGIVDVGWGLHAPAAVYAAGAALVFRDFVQRTLGRWWGVGAIIAGALLSLLVAPAFALASGVAFLVSESFDFAVYTPLVKRSFIGAVAVSCTVGLAIDSVVFLSISPLPLSLLPGQIVGKLETIGLTVMLIAAWRLFRPHYEPVPVSE